MAAAGFEIGPAAWAFGGAVVVAIFNQGVTLLKEQRQRRGDHQRERNRIALTVSAALEGYAQSCAACVQDVGWAETEASAQGHEDALRGIQLPDFVLPDSPDWRWVSAELAHAILGLQLKIQSSRRHIRDLVETHVSAFETIEVIEQHARRHGKRAWQLADRLRKEAGLPPSDLAGEEWDLTHYLQ